MSPTSAPRRCSRISSIRKSSRCAARDVRRSAGQHALQGARATPQGARGRDREAECPEPPRANDDVEYWALTPTPSRKARNARHLTRDGTDAMRMRAKVALANPSWCRKAGTGLASLGRRPATACGRMSWASWWWTRSGRPGNPDRIRDASRNRVGRIVTLATFLVLLVL